MADLDLPGPDYAMTPLDRAKMLALRTFGPALGAIDYVTTPKETIDSAWNTGQGVAFNNYRTANEIANFERSRRLGQGDLEPWHAGDRESTNIEDRRYAEGGSAPQSAVKDILAQYVPQSVQDWYSRQAVDPTLADRPWLTQLNDVPRQAVPGYAPLQDAYQAHEAGSPFASYEVGGNLGKAAMELGLPMVFPSGISRSVASRMTPENAAYEYLQNFAWSPAQRVKHAIQKAAFAGAASYPPRAVYDALSEPKPEQISNTDSPDSEKAQYEATLARRKWGPDAPWTIPEKYIGDVPYRYQGVGLHALLAAMTARVAPAVSLGNLGYIGYSLGTGRTQRPHITEEEMAKHRLPGGVGKEPY